MPSLGELLVEKQLISEKQLAYALNLQKSKYGLLGEILIDLGFATESRVLDTLTQQLSTEYRPIVYVQGGTELVTLYEEIPHQVLQMLPVKLVMRVNAMPVRFSAPTDELTVAMIDPTDFKAVDELRFAARHRIKPVRATRADLHHLWRRHYKVDSRSSNEQQIDLTADLLDQGGVLAEGAVVKLVDNIFLKAIALNASDIHFDEFDDSVCVRFRIDGVLYTVLSFPATIYPTLVARIKVVSELDVSEKRVNQDGRVTIKRDEGPIDLRISVLPVFNGERIAVRIQNRGGMTFGLSSLGLGEKLGPVFERELARPNGLILVTGPTGSGKTTTLYSLLNHLNDKSRNIISIEDPVEYPFEGIGQVQVDERAGVTFASALRSVLRQDPNVIMVGEIRDEATAQTAIRASLTGHLVLATAHTNDAPSAIDRLVSMQVKPYLIASSLNLAIAQRLLRRICKECRQPNDVDPKKLLRLGIKPKQVEKLKFFAGSGCPKCSFTGFKGRVAIYEVMTMSAKVRKIITESGTVEQLRQQAKRDSMVTLVLDGIQKARQGLTTVDEVLQHTHYESLAVVT